MTENSPPMCPRPAARTIWMSRRRTCRAASAQVGHGLVPVRRSAPGRGPAGRQRVGVVDRRSDVRDEVLVLLDGHDSSAHAGEQDVLDELLRGQRVLAACASRRASMSRASSARWMRLEESDRQLGRLDGVLAERELVELPDALPVVLLAACRRTRTSRPGARCRRPCRRPSRAGCR